MVLWYTCYWVQLLFCHSVLENIIPCGNLLLTPYKHMVWRQFWLYCGEPHSMPCRLSETTTAIFVRSIREFWSGDCALNLCQLMVSFRFLFVHIVHRAPRISIYDTLYRSNLSVFQCLRNSELVYDTSIIFAMTIVGRRRKREAVILTRP